MGEARATVSPEPERYATLDAWRGLACLLVVGFHAVGRWVDETHQGLACAPIRLLGAGGSIGVPLFFTISGWCIAAAAGVAAAAGTPARRFLARRFRRIYPPYFAALALAVLLALAGRVLSLGPPDGPVWDRTDVGAHWITNLTLLEEPLQMFGVEPVHVIAPAWSLDHEQQFYVFMAFLFAAAAATTRRRALVAMSVLSVAATAAFGARRLGILLDTWPLFALGIWAHERGRAREPRGRLGLDLWAGGTVAALLAAYAIRTGRLGQEAKQVVICAAFAVGLVALRRHDAALMRSAPVRLLAALGRRSYSLYLVHFPIVMTIGDALYPAGWTRGPRLYATALLSTAVSLAVAWVFYRVVERRFLSRPPTVPDSP